MSTSQKVTRIEYSVDTLVTLPGDTAKAIFAVRTAGVKPYITEVSMQGGGTIDIEAEAIKSPDGYDIAITAKSRARQMPVRLLRREVREENDVEKKVVTESNRPLWYYLAGICITILILFVSWKLIKKYLKK